MPPETPVTFPSGDVTLEGRLSVAGPEAAAVVICHPHPSYGGSMDNNVVYAVRDAVTAVGPYVRCSSTSGAWGEAAGDRPGS